jgi:hypothetical protein
MTLQSLRNRRRDDEGSILPLIAFYGFLCLALVLLVAAASSLYLERKRLFTLADGAALVGAESFSLDDVEVTADGPRPRLDSKDVAAAVRDYIADTDTGGFTSLHIVAAETLDDRSATVTLSAYWSPPIVSALVPEGFPIEVTAVARSVFD